MQKNRFTIMLVFLSIVLFTVTSALAQAEVPKGNGTLSVVIDADPPTIDPHSSSSTLVFVVGYHVFEGLYALDGSFKPIPMLAETLPEISRDKLTYTISLRQGLSFHNGDPVTVEDVVASIKRWGARSKYGKGIFKHLESIAAVDQKTIVIKMKRPTGTVVTALAMPNGGAFIYPKDLCEKYADKPLEEYVGTGPFKFVECARTSTLK